MEKFYLSYTFDDYDSLPPGSCGKWISNGGWTQVYPADFLLCCISFAIYEVEVGGEQRSYQHGLKVERFRLVRRVDSWNRVTARTFAIDCAERVQDLYTGLCGIFARSVKTARDYLLGEAEAKEVISIYEASWSAVCNAIAASVKTADGKVEFTGCSGSGVVEDVSERAIWAGQAAAYTSHLPHSDDEPSEMCSAGFAAHGSAMCARWAAGDSWSTQRYRGGPESEWQLSRLKELLGI